MSVTLRKSLSATPRCMFPWIFNVERLAGAQTIVVPYYKKDDSKNMPAKNANRRSTVVAGKARHPLLSVTPFGCTLEPDSLKTHLVPCKDLPRVQTTVEQIDPQRQMTSTDANL